EDSTGLAAMPVTEDTMGSAPDVEAASMPDVITPLPSMSQSPESVAAYDVADDSAGSSYGDAQDSLMGIPDDARMSVEEGLADMTGISGSAAAIGSIPDVSSYPDEEEAVAAPSGDTGNGGSTGNEWAANALDLLHRAQSALSGGDWGMFGEAMNNLASTLHNAASGAAPASATPTPPAPPSYSEPVWSSSDASVGSVPVQAVQDDSMSGSPSVYMGSANTPAIDYVGNAPVSTSYEAPAPTPTPDSSSTGAAVSDPASTMEPAPSLIDALPATPSTVTPMATATPVQAPGASSARLILISTGAEMTIPEQEEITVGREDPSSGIFPDVDLTPHGGEDGGVSRRHARMLHIGDDYFVEDLQSTNFTKLDGQRLPAHVRERLEDGARLDFGRVAMIFRRG
ncbi:MAG: FHA domain-containing protein, partial [Chloroflexia bacterium]